MFAASASSSWRSAPGSRCGRFRASNRSLPDDPLAPATMRSSAAPSSAAGAALEVGLFADLRADEEHGATTWAATIQADRLHGGQDGPWGSPPVTAHAPSPGLLTDHAAGEAAPGGARRRSLVPMPLLGASGGAAVAAF